MWAERVLVLWGDAGLMFYGKARLDRCEAVVEGEAGGGNVGEVSICKLELAVHGIFEGAS